MIRIIDHQMQAFEAAAFVEANVRLAGYARERFPEELGHKSEAELTELAVAVRRDARAHGVTAEADVATALDLTVMYGPDFYSAEWASDVLEIPEWDGTHKMDVLRRRVRRRVQEL